VSHENLKERTKRFALAAVRLVESLPRDRACDVLGRQLLRSGTSVGANYRAACRAKSPADFISRATNVEEEADESAFWMELLLDLRKVKPAEAGPLKGEAEELVAIMVTSAKTARRSLENAPKRPSGTSHSAFRTPHSL
jgi:four helix bundle protein